MAVTASRGRQPVKPSSVGGHMPIRDACTPMARALVIDQQRIPTAAPPSMLREPGERIANEARTRRIRWLAVDASVRPYLALVSIFVLLPAAVGAIRADGGNRLFVAGFGVLFALVWWIGYADLVTTVRDLQVRRTSAEWPVTAGTVVVSAVECAPSRYGRVCYPHVEYDFCIEEKRWRGVRVAFTKGTGAIEEAEEVVALLPPERVVAVRYDPADPTRAVLTRHAPRFDAALMLAAFGMIAVSMPVAVILLAFTS